MELISVKLGDLVASGEAIIKTGPFGTQLKAAEYVDYGTPVINVKNIGFGAVVRNKLDMVGQATLERLEAHILRAGDIVFGRKGAVERHAYISEAEAGWMQGSDCIRLRIDSKRVNSHYLSYYFLTPKHQAFMIGMCSHGTTMASLNQKILEQIEIPIPDIKIQNRVVSILNTIDDRISINSKINDNLQEQAQTLFAERFCLRNSDPVPEGWSLVSLGDVAVISNKSFNPLKQPETMLEHYSIPAFDEKRYPVFELSTEIKSNKFIVDSDCFMISKLNPTTKRVWRPYCMTENAVCSTEFIVYKAKVRELTDFLYSLIDSASFSDFMCSHVTGSTGSRQRTTPSDTLQYQFYMPTADEIADFSAVVAPMYAQIRINAMENARLKGLRDSLLPRLMSGEIDMSGADI